MVKGTGEPALPNIYRIRRQRVMLDSQLAALFGVPTRSFNQAIHRNRKRFPADFAFQLTPDELTNLRSQSATSKASEEGSLRSQFVTLEKVGVVSIANTCLGSSLSMVR